MEIRQGEIYWASLAEPVGSEPGFQRPVVVVQNNLVNSTRIGTVIVCVLTTNVRLSESIGNISLRKGEAGLERPSVVNVSQMLTLDKTALEERIGELSAKRIHEVIQGIHQILEPSEDE